MDHSEREDAPRIVGHMDDTDREIFFQGQMPGTLELAYVGDSVWDLFVRTRLCRRGGRMKDLHRKAVAHVCARAQSDALARVEVMLTEGEADVVRRARNAHQHPTKNADPGDYHRATAFEALLGYLYLTGRRERLEAVMNACLAEDDPLNT